MFILQYSGKNKKFNFDPIDYASIDKIEFWVVQEEEPPLLDYEKLENALYGERVYPIEEGSSHAQGDQFILNFVNSLPSYIFLINCYDI